MIIELLRYTFDDTAAADEIGCYIDSRNITVQGLPDGTIYVETSVMPGEIYMPFEREHKPSEAESALRRRLMEIMNSKSSLTDSERAELTDIVDKMTEISENSGSLERALADADTAPMMKKALEYNIGQLPKKLNDLIDRLYSEGKVSVEICSAFTD